MRKSIEGLSLVIVEHLASNPANGTVYVFINKKRDKLKLLYWDRNGFCLLYKRLEKQRFLIPSMDAKEESMLLKPEQLRWLIDGLDISKIKGFERLEYSHFY
jgi:transposase